MRLLLLPILFGMTPLPYGTACPAFPVEDDQHNIKCLPKLRLPYLVDPISDRNMILWFSTE